MRPPLPPGPPRRTASLLPHGPVPSLAENEPLQTLGVAAARACPPRAGGVGREGAADGTWVTAPRLAVDSTAAAAHGGVPVEGARMPRAAREPTARRQPVLSDYLRSQKRVQVRRLGGAWWRAPQLHGAVHRCHLNRYGTQLARRRARLRPERQRQELPWSPAHTMEISHRTCLLVARGLEALLERCQYSQRLQMMDSLLIHAPRPSSLPRRREEQPTPRRTLKSASTCGALCWMTMSTMWAVAPT